MKISNNNQDLNQIVQGLASELGINGWHDAKGHVIPHYFGFNTVSGNGETSVECWYPAFEYHLSAQTEDFEYHVGINPTSDGVAVVVQVKDRTEISANTFLWLQNYEAATQYFGPQQETEESIKWKEEMRSEYAQLLQWQPHIAVSKLLVQANSTSSLYCHERQGDKIVSATQTNGTIWSDDQELQAKMLQTVYDQQQQNGMSEIRAETMEDLVRSTFAAFQSYCTQK